MKKIKIYQIIFVLLLCLSFLNLPLTKNKVFAETNYILYVGNTQVTTENADNIIEVDNKILAHYNEQSNCLYINELILKTSENYFYKTSNSETYSYGIYTQIEDLTIIIEKNSYLGNIFSTSQTENILDYGIYSTEDLNIKGDFLNIYASKYGIYSTGNIYFEDLESTIYAKDVGIYGKVITSKNCKQVINSGDNGIIANSDFFIIGSQITSYTENENSVSIICKHNLDIKDNLNKTSLLSAKGNTGIEVSNQINLNDKSQLTAYGKNNFAITTKYFYLNNSSTTGYARLLAEVEIDNVILTEIYALNILNGGFVKVGDGQIKLYSPHGACNANIQLVNYPKAKIYAGLNEETCERVDEYQSSNFINIGTNLYPLQIDWATVILVIILIILIIILILLIIKTFKDIYGRKNKTKKKKNKEN